MTIRCANTSDAAALTTLTQRSKAYWNYSDLQLSQWQEELTITESYIEINSVRILYVNDQMRGYYSYLKQATDIVLLDNLFIDPDFIGHGYGTYLMTHLFTELKNQGFRRVRLHADPNAKSFYIKFGFQVVGNLPSSIKDRYLPILELKLSDSLSSE